MVDEVLRTTLMRVADVLIPATETMPAASTAGVHLAGLDRVLKARPDLEPPLTNVLREAAGEDPSTYLERLGGENPDGFAALVTVVAGGYYLNADVTRRLGYVGPHALLPAPEEAAYYLRDGCLDPVENRPPMFRPTPVDSEEAT